MVGMGTVRGRRHLGPLAGRAVLEQNSSLCRGRCRYRARRRRSVLKFGTGKARARRGIWRGRGLWMFFLCPGDRRRACGEAGRCYFLVSKLFGAGAGWFTFEACRVRRKTFVVWSCAATSSRVLGRLINISQASRSWK